MYESRMNLANCNITKKICVVVPTHIKYPIFNIFLKVQLFSKLRRPFVRIKRPIPLVNSKTPRISKFNQQFLPNISDG